MSQQQQPVLLGLGAALPSRVMENAEWATWVDTSDEWIRSRTGIRRRRVAGPGETTAVLAERAARAALADAGLEPADLDEIVLATDTPELPCPDTAALLQHRLGAREIPAYDLAGSGCAGFLQGLDLACSRVRTVHRRVLVVGVEVITRIMSWEDRSTCVLFGDAAGAVVVGAPGSGGQARVVDVLTGTDGSKAGILGREVGGTRIPMDAEQVARGEHQRIVMLGREVFKEAVARMSAAARGLLERHGLDPDAVDLFVPHQANLRILQAVARELKLPMERVYVNVQEYGNTGSASVPLALWEAREHGRIAAGARVLCTAFGAGFHWAAALLEFR